MAKLSQTLLNQLQKLETDAEFTANLPQVRSSGGNQYFTKVGSVAEKEQYSGEAESLKAMDIIAPGLAPRVLAFGITDDTEVEGPGRPYFISEYKDIGPLSDKTAEVLGRRLATELHRNNGSHKFGFGIPTYCGATRLQNGWFETWEECYSAMIGDLLSQLRKKGGYENLCNSGEVIRSSVIPHLLRPLVIEPVLLHGDLWSGNTGTDRNTGNPVIFDPSSYYGHNEADLAIARIFGGFPSSFFTTYHKHNPKTEPVDQYEQRGDLYELFHYLNHTLLFGGGYAASAMKKIDKLMTAL